MPVFIKFPPASTDADWRGQIEVLDEDTGAGFDLTGKTIILEVQDKFGTQKLRGSTTSGEVTLTDAANGIFTFVFRKSAMNALDPAVYRVGCVMTEDSDTDHVFTGELPVQEGYVS